MTNTGTPAVTEEERLLSHLYKALNEVPSCGCGWPDEARRLVWDTLSLMPTYGAEKKQWLAALIGPEASQQIVLSAIEGAGLISHGTSITSSWLEPRGRWVLWAVEKVGGIDGLHAKLEDTGFPHEWDRELKDMQPCTDACWVMPDGWEPPATEGPESKPEPTWDELLAAMNPIERSLAEDMMRRDMDTLLYGNGPTPGEPKFTGIGGLLGGTLPTVMVPYPKAAPPGPPRLRYDPATKNWEPIR